MQIDHDRASHDVWVDFALAAPFLLSIAGGGFLNWWYL